MTQLRLLFKLVGIEEEILVINFQISIIFTWYLFYAPVILGNNVSFKDPQMELMPIIHFLNSVEIKIFAYKFHVHFRVVPA